MVEEWWIPLTLAAAFLQNARSMLQKRLTGRLSIVGASHARFVYALPFAWLYLALLSGWQAPPATTAAFWAYCAAGALGQIFATACLLAAFTMRNFAVGTALSKTEVVQTALIGLVFLGDAIEPLAWAGIAVSLAGVLLMSGWGPRQWRRMLRPGAAAGTEARALLLGLLAGAGFAVAAVGFRGAATTLPEGSALMRAALTLAVALSLQTLVMGVYLARREPGELARVARAWRPALAIGACGMLASVGWFTAMTLQAAALVRALGQIELLFALAAATWYFKERIRPRELAGVALLVAGIYLLL